VAAEVGWRKEEGSEGRGKQLHMVVDSPLGQMGESSANAFLDCESSAAVWLCCLILFARLFLAMLRAIDYVLPLQVMGE
jgi:hypothetical protein